MLAIQITRQNRGLPGKAAAIAAHKETNASSGGSQFDRINKYDPKNNSSVNEDSSFMCSRGRCSFKNVGENVFECVHGVKHTCDSECELASFSFTGATYACPVSGISKQIHGVVMDGVAITIDESNDEDERDCLPRVEIIVNTLLPGMSDLDRYALAFEIARVRRAYVKLDQASLVSHTLAILYKMKGDGWRCSGIDVISHDELVKENLCDETELEKINGVVSCSMKDITKGDKYIGHALNKVNPATHVRRAVSFVAKTKIVPPSLIVRPRSVVVEEVRTKFEMAKARFVPDAKRFRE